MPDFLPIGTIRSKFSDSASPEDMKKEESTIILKEEFAEGLDKITEYDYIKIVFHLHEAEGYELVGPRRYGGVRGVFASRSPYRPNSIGVTLVKLIERRENRLKVIGLDAIDKTPVLDIKPYAAEIDDPEQKFT